MKSVSYTHLHLPHDTPVPQADFVLRPWGRKHADGAYAWGTGVSLSVSYTHLAVRFCETVLHPICCVIVDYLHSRNRSLSDRERNICMVRSVSYTHLLSDVDMTLQDMDAIGVTYGPGLVGALLVGVAEAKAISYAVSYTHLFRESMKKI